MPHSPGPNELGTGALIAPAPPYAKSVQLPTLKMLDYEVAVPIKAIVEPIKAKAWEPAVRGPQCYGHAAR
jgi:hypothetical protein